MKTAIMLAAGFSSRMGSWKMMLPWNQRTVLDSALQNALAFCDQVILVTGFRGAELHQRYGHHPAIKTCHNRNFSEGMFSSLRCGTAALTGGHFFVVPGDMPAIDPAVYACLWQHAAADCCLQPFCDGGNGHPVLLPPPLISQILNAPPESNLRSMMQAFGRRSIPVNSKTIHWDLDTPAQYQRLRALPALSTSP